MCYYAVIRRERGFLISPRTVKLHPIRVLLMKVWPIYNIVILKYPPFFDRQNILVTKNFLLGNVDSIKINIFSLES